MVMTLELDRLRLAWESYVVSRTIAPEVDPHIAASWHRCWGYLSPFQTVRLSPLSSNNLLSAQVANFDLISVARPVMEDSYQYLENSGIAFVLVNSAGYVLDILGDADMLEKAVGLGIRTGSLLSESAMGTNAFALALVERIPQRVVGCEHYLSQFHSIAGTAAPIFDLTGRPLGAVGLLTRASDYLHPYLSIAVAVSRAIEGQRQSDQLLAEQNRQLTTITAVLDTISEGILVWNPDRVLIHINSAAARLLDTPVNGLVGRRVGEFFSFPDFLLEAVEKREPLSDIDSYLIFKQQTYNCILSLRFAGNSSSPEWTIIAFRQVQDVNNLLQRHFGSQAYLTLEDIVGESTAIRRVRRLAESAADARASILILGESGTGKNALARAIQYKSPRRDLPFIIFACASIPNQLITRELLGFESGYSEQYKYGRPSKFELAQGGTLFFQDVDYLPLEAQAVLLDVLELHLVNRLGSIRPIPVDVRIIAASSADMDKLVEQGAFRSDLYYRLSSFKIAIPPLRERPRDIPLLVDRILERLSQQTGHPLSMAPGVLDLLKRYSWPGNIRQLESVLYQAAMQTDQSGIISQAHLPPSITNPMDLDFPLSLNPFPTSFVEIERDALIRAAKLCGGNVTQMARVLGLGRTTVWRKLKEHNLAVEEFR